MSEKERVLKEFFGFSSFRTGQEAIVDALLARRDALAVMPTGAGKSLCYQLPSLLLPGTTLVISPLISLMKDQVESLVQQGIAAACLNSSLSEAEMYATFERANRGEIAILYVAPERLLTPSFLRFCEKTPISLVAVDEAHCVSQWGQDFRPSYLAIPSFIGRLLQRPVLGAFTATATAAVKQDILKILQIGDHADVTTGYDRKNLCFSVLMPRNKKATLTGLLPHYRGKSGIVYCSTRKNVEEICGILLECGIAATRYHGGLSAGERKKNQEDFLYDRSSVMVATNAFGMGIDKSNVRFVIHYNMPKDIESYYQEAGRAGRDGEAADCILLYGGQDVRLNQFLIENGENKGLDDATRRLVQARAFTRLKTMTDYCRTKQCLRHYILSYFGETAAVSCGNCSNCLKASVDRDITVDAQKIMSAVKRTGEIFGVQTIVQVLRGSKAAAILKRGLDTQSTYGIMKDVSEARLKELIYYLVEEGFLCSSGGQYPGLSLGQKAPDVLFHGEILTMPETVASEEEKAGDVREEVHEDDDMLFARLKALRWEMAQEQGVPAYLVFSDADLRDMCRKLPRTEEEFLSVRGVGQRKAERYATRFLLEIADFLGTAD